MRMAIGFLAFAVVLSLAADSVQACSRRNPKCVPSKPKVAVPAPVPKPKVTSPPGGPSGGVGRGGGSVDPSQVRRGAGNLQAGGSARRAFNSANISFANAENLRVQKAIPSNWMVRRADKSNGVVFNPPSGNTHTAVRMMPGEPNATYPSQRGPYVKHSIDGTYYDVSRSPVPGKSEAAHIPFAQYVFWTK